MKVLICFNWFTPAYKAGGPVQSLKNMVDYLTSADCSFSILCSNSDIDKAALPVEPDKWMTIKKTSTVWYASHYGLQRFINLINNTHPSVIYINGLYSFYFNIIPLLWGRSPRILAPRGMLDPGSLSQKPIKKKIYLLLWKLSGIYKRCTYHATGETEKKNIQAVFGDVKVFVAPNFPTILQYTQPPVKEKGKLRLISIALISPMKNILLVLKVLQNCPFQVVYDIYGPVKERAYWDNCLQLMASLPSHIRVSYYGSIRPHAVEQALSNAHVFIQPSKSENFGHSIFEALTAGKPVIISTNTPWNGLKQQRAGINVSTNGINELTAAIKLFADMSDGEYKEWSFAARKYALAAINIEKIKEQYFEMFNVAGN